MVFVGLKKKKKKKKENGEKVKMSKLELFQCKHVLERSSDVWMLATMFA